jgi:hypothetical protein
MQTQFNHPSASGFSCILLKQGGWKNLQALRASGRHDKPSTVRFGQGMRKQN